jgi:hypothetical protein
MFCVLRRCAVFHNAAQVLLHLVRNLVSDASRPQALYHPDTTHFIAMHQLRDGLEPRAKFMWPRVGSSSNGLPRI